MLLVDNRQNKIEVTNELEDLLEKIIDFTLKEEKVLIDYEISLIFTDNSEIRTINKEYRKIDKETDVLSFPMLEYPKNKVYKDVYQNFSFDDSYFDEGKLVMGDIAISLERAKAQCEEYGHSFFREVCYLSVHSILHLLGYDHMEEDEKIIMRDREEYILQEFNIAR
ncbi:rRNA maturation RNase YbeY [Clostridium sp. YIM B02515]|uniref:Endoribonuclease YbeY n=1 Tax=Clostridium rhizosphaerae TaxID=2803861 RepID=A0ABS1T911_9CLOT|nr:rRNA maturation RNase YbeY [Clostridium rhizosphaerae]MBL4935166.1 rRNA maturation RNase YbeY [Clostridium rhizosphaerae]